MAKHDLKSAMAHAKAVQELKNNEEKRILRELEEQKRLEQEREAKKELELLQKDCHNLYEWIVYPEEYHMECGVVWATHTAEAEHKIRNRYPNAFRVIINKFDVKHDIVRIASYIE